MPKRKTLGLIGLALAGIGLYQFRRQFLGRWLGLCPHRYQVSVRHSLRISIPGGIELAADHYFPKGERLFPTILLRTPYGRNHAAGPVGRLTEFIAQRFAERGYNVIVQDIRGRFDSQGSFEPFLHEGEDGRATIAWLEKQNWFNGVLGMWGPSYPGYTQWAVAAGAPLYLKALLPAMTGTRLPIMGIRDQAFELDAILRWIFVLHALSEKPKFFGLNRLYRFSPRLQDRVVQQAANSLPLSQADRALIGKTVPFYQEWLQHPSSEDPYWQKLDISKNMRSITPAAHLVGGWYDVFLREIIADYQALRASGQNPYLTIGPWNHLDPEGVWEALRQGITWFDAHLKGDRQRLRTQPVLVYVMGKNEWREMGSWPPPNTKTSFFLHASQSGKREGELSLLSPSCQAAPSSYLYDPTKPTSLPGGALLSQHAGPRENRALEKQSDVLTFTGPALEKDLEIMGAMRLALYVRSSQAYTDFIGRVCDVHPDGHSVNISDGILRLQPDEGKPQTDGARRIEIDLWATAHCFQRGHRLRLHICSANHPRWNRNLGGPEALGQAAHMLPAWQEIFHDEAHPSMLILPVTA